MESRLRCTLCHQPFHAHDAAATESIDEYGDPMCERCRTLSIEVRTLLRRRETKRMLHAAALGPLREAKSS